MLHGDHRVVPGLVVNYRGVQGEAGRSPFGGNRNGCREADDVDCEGNVVMGGARRLRLSLPDSRFSEVCRSDMTGVAAVLELKFQLADATNYLT